MDGGAWWAAVHGIAKSQTQLSDFTFTFHFHALEKEMATHSSVLAWRIPGSAEPWWAAVFGVAQSQTRLKRLSSSSKRSRKGCQVCSWACLALKASARDTHSSVFGWELGGPLCLCGLSDLHLPLDLLPCPSSLPPQVAPKGIVVLGTLNSL